MNAKEHPEYNFEQEKLTEIQKTISKEHNELVVKSQNFKNLSKNVITDPEVFSQLVRITNDRLSTLSTLSNKPYFGRVDFCELGKDKEMFYIGKTSIDDPETKKLIVLDWRAPLAGLYYSGEIGDVMYGSPEGVIMGDLYLKRQYEIMEGELINIFDKGLTPMDEFLQKALWEKKDNRLGDIVTTIQDEQNQIIRAPKDGVLIIQGVAGSGKTTIVLHRIAYLMYTYQDLFKAEKILMIVPNRLFLDYISDVLPDLGVHNIEQVTFEMLYYKIFKKELEISSEINKLKNLISLAKEDEKRQQYEFVSAFKGSLRLKQIIDNYVAQLLVDSMPKEDIELLNKVLYSYQELENLFNVQYAYMPLARRKEKLIMYVKDTIEDRIAKLQSTVKRQYEKKLSEVKSKEHVDEISKKSQITRVVDRNLELNRHLEESIKTVPKAYQSKWENLNIEKCLLQLLSDSELLKMHASGILNDSEVDLITHYTKRVVKSKIELEDIPALIYLKFRVEGSELIKSFTHIIVDEAQDYNPLQMHVLKMLSSNNSFTIVGDIAQGINAYRGISGWNELTNQVFKPQMTTYKTITICYRSTKEIIDFGNSVIATLNDDNIVLGKPALRTGNKPCVVSCLDETLMIHSIVNRVKALKQKGYKSIALMCKTEMACRDLCSQISEAISEDIQLLTGEEEHYRSGITIMTPQLSKGLEFDAVIILDLNKDAYQRDPLHIKLFYVAITRALHELFVYHMDQPTELISQIDENLYERVCVS